MQHSSTESPKPRYSRLKRTVVILLGLIPFILGLLYFLWPKHQSDVEAVFERYTTPNSYFIDYDGGQVHYVDTGYGERVVVAIHGLNSCFYHFTPLLENTPILDSFRVIGIDLPGFGLSNPPHYKTLPEDFTFQSHFTGAVAAVLEDAGIDSCMILANSLGGMLSWNLAYERPDLVQSMMLMAPAGYAWDSITRPYVEGMAPWYVGAILNLRLGVSRESREDAATYSFYNKEVLPSNWFSHRVDAGYAFMNLPDRIHWQRTMILSQEMADTTRIQQLTQPTMILWGEEDEVLPFAHRSRFMRDLQEGYLVEMPATGHVPHEEDPRFVFNLLYDFYNRQQSTVQDELEWVQSLD